ncbi:uncharacterized protein LOC122049969 [Zingiber officinale]|uniref:Tetratricopeptide repeat-like superfamily protein n=1 Tax=Zingiber officinale TaxID=94328 RepID=A0A8J5I9C7_ZINOF|nr:uncharacterized protein LOC122049969 [Zingiber officinale]KAG6531300.1 hypothetical protein ZIOFF_005104 [Zingiber officinale]
MMGVQATGRYFTSPIIIPIPSQSHPTYQTAGGWGAYRALARPSASLGSKILRTRSAEFLRTRGRHGGALPLRGARSASLDPFDDDADDECEEDSVRKVEDLAVVLSGQKAQVGELERNKQTPYFSPKSTLGLFPSIRSPWMLGFREDPPEWSNLIVPACVEANADGVRIPLSLRIIKLKKRFEASWFIETGETACCSMKRAFSSMVFMIRELQRYALQWREALLCEENQGILGRIQIEMNYSFVCLFQQIFSATPTLMVSLMLLLANFTIFYMDHFNLIGAAVTPSNASSVFCLIDTLIEENDRDEMEMEMEMATAEDEVGQGVWTETLASEEAVLWEKFLEEFARLQATTRHEALMDPDTMRRMVSPVSIELQTDDKSDHLRTEMMYEQALGQDPDSPLLLSNFAQFLYLVLHQNERAEHYFSKAITMAPRDAETLSRYASFLWVARGDLMAAEETFLEAIAAAPGNTAHTANYAHFLWSTGGEGTCYPLAYDVGLP